MPRLFIVDPSLKDLRGHHYMLTRAATKSAQAAGFDVTWLCSTAFSPELDQSGAAIAPVFGASMYDAYLQKPGATAGRLAGWRRRFAKALGVGVAQQKAPSAAAASRFATDLLGAIKDFAIGAGDRILLHTADGESLLAVAQYAKVTALDAMPIIHVATPYDPVGVMPNKQNIEQLTPDIAILRDQNKLDRKLFLYAENALLAAHLTEIWSAPVRPLPLPVTAGDPSAAQAARTQMCEKLGINEDAFLVVSLGSARLEKGFHLMPDIVRRVFEFAGEDARAKIKFVLHASPQIIGRDPVIAKAIDALQARPDGDVFLLLDGLSDDDYQALLHASDVVLMPYGEREYRVRGSAVVTEAISAGKSIVAKPGTYPGAAAEQHGGRTGAAPIDMAKAIIEIFDQREAFAARAASERNAYIADNAIEKYWRRCLDAEAAV